MLKIRVANKKGYQEAYPGDSVNLEQPNSKTRRGRVGNQMANTLNTGNHQAVVMPNFRIRKLTPTECWLLMGFEKSDVQKCMDIGTSNTQLYKQAGNSIVVPVLEGIFTNLLMGDSNENN